jgi:hypothetical protein
MRALFAVGAFAFVIALPVCASGQAGGAASPPSAAPKPLDPADIEARRKDAEGRLLFSSDGVLEFTLTADFKAVNRDRNPESRRVFPATLTVARHDGGASATFPLNIRTRGHVRRLPQTCTFAPLRLEFQADHIKSTIFEGHKNIKLGTHCRDADLFEQYVPREYAAYRINNLLTPQSFRARLAKATYVDTESQKVIATRQAIFIEDDDDVAKRMGGRIIETQKLVYRRVDWETVTLMTLLQYMIGNTDWSMYLLHNIVLVQVPKGTIYPVPYDFDYSGLVDARYAIPAKQFNLTSVRDRLYLGPCRPPEELDPFFTRFHAIKDQTYALFDSIPGMEDNYRRSSQKYLDRFYQTISRPNDVKRAFVDGCNKRVGM